MPRKTPTQVAKRTKKAETVTEPTPEKETKQKGLSVPGVDSTELVTLMNSRIDTSTAHWNGKEYNLKNATEENTNLYLGKQVSERDDGSNPNLALDNRIFSSVRTIVPYVTARVTEPEVYPSSNLPAARKFSEDFAKALHIKAEREKLRQKLKYAVEDALIRRRGYLKPRYDHATKNWFALEYIPCESIIIDHEAKPTEEPRYFRHHLKRSISDLCTMFPDMKKQIYEAFNLVDNPPKTKLDEVHTINEDWCFVPIDGELDLVVSWSYKKLPLGVIQDPNWRYGDNNFLPHHMMPLIPINFLSDGRAYIDKTSYVEQAKYAQKTVDKRSEQISRNASLGTVGMPIVDSEALSQEDGAYLTYDEEQTLFLKVPDGKRISDVFDKWQASTLPGYVFDDKLDARSSVDNAFGTSNVMRGEESKNKTATQDMLLRDQAQGRQQEIIDAIDSAMTRLYMLMAQFLLVYGDETELFKLVGEDGQFDYIIMNTDTLDTEAEIRVKSGTSMPVDKSQRRATADKAAQMGIIDPLTFWEIMDEPNAQKYAKRVAHWTNDPASFLKDTEEEVFDRDAYTDIEMIKHGKAPDFRKELKLSYFDYLNKYVLSGALEDPEIALETRQTIEQFIEIQLDRGRKMLGMAETQLPTPEEVTDYNMQVDAANQAMPPEGQAPAGPPQPPVK